MTSQIAEDHPSKETLTCYLTEPESGDYAAVHLHVCHCERCQNVVRKMEVVLFGLGSAAAARKTDATLSAQPIPFSPRPKADSPVHPEIAVPREPSSLQRKIPAWSVIPSALAAGLLLTVIFTPLGSSLIEDSAVVLAVYQDAAHVRIAPADSSTASIGFFDEAAVETAPYAGISIAYTDGQYQIAWPPVQNAVEYRFVIHLNEGDKPQPVGSGQTKDLHVTLPAEAPRQGVRYTWRLHGEMSDGRIFESRGGFVRADS